ncbi:MAG: hypothetical protein JSV62_04385 [Promethearchaeota archaeon]|nr:MAG: hypothetical protein JSV62_04385 [Candidatus Lokiarchaeota archaeon]
MSEAYFIPTRLIPWDGYIIKHLARTETRLVFLFMPAPRSMWVLVVRCRGR